VSYFACGIIANLALRWDDVYTSLTAEDRPLMLQELVRKLKCFFVCVMLLLLATRLSDKGISITFVQKSKWRHYYQN